MRALREQRVGAARAIRREVDRVVGDFVALEHRRLQQPQSLRRQVLGEELGRHRVAIGAQTEEERPVVAEHLGCALLDALERRL